MFPLNLQRNIVQLDKQISLLENECKNLEMEKKKKNQKPDGAYSSCSKNSHARFKAPTVRVSVKNGDNCKRSKKSTLPVSARLQPTGSLPSHCSRAWSENGNTSAEKRAKSCAVNSKIPSCLCRSLGSPSNLRKENKCVKCVCCNELVGSEFGSNNTIEPKKKDHVLLFPNAGGTIEVTVTQKPISGKENSPCCHISPIKSNDLEKEAEKNSDECKCQNKGQKWSEILSLESTRKRQSINGSFVKNNISTDEIKLNYLPPNLNNNRGCEEYFFSEYQNNTGSNLQDGTFEIPVKLPSQSSKPKNHPEVNSNKFEKEVQCSLESNYSEVPKKELKDPVKIFQLLVKQFQQMSGDDLKKSSNSEDYTKINDACRKEPEEKKINSPAMSSDESNASYFNTLKYRCENLIKEKTLLTEELAAKDNAISIMSKREEEYLSLISSLKSSLEKTKEKAQEGAEAVKQMSIIKNNLLDQIKMSEAWKNRLLAMQRFMEHCCLENDKLKTEIKILKLEAQKHEVLLAGKEAQINRYKQEIQNFQQQISEHLSSLKSNSQGIDVEKMMEVIMQQSQIFAQTDLDSFMEKDTKNSSKGQNILMHSSPTSTKTSVVNSSWKQISSIYEHEQSKANSDVIYLNEDGNEKGFFQVFGRNSMPELASAKETKKPSVENLLEKKEMKNSSSFTSCISLNEDHNMSKSTSRDSLISKEEFPTSVEEEGGVEEKKGSATLSDKVQRNIDELLKNVKLRFSKEIFETSLPSHTTGECLDISQISSISPL